LYVFFWVFPRRQTPGKYSKENIQAGYNRLLALLRKHYSGDQSTSMEWAMHEACREAKNDACGVLVDKSE
jgi:hypothetical protein